MFKKISSLALVFVCAQASFAEAGNCEDLAEKPSSTPVEVVCGSAKAINSAIAKVLRRESSHRASASAPNLFTIKLGGFMLSGTEDRQPCVRYQVGGL